MEALKLIRKERKLRQQDLADYLGITVSAYGNYELGQREPDLSTLCKLADFFNTTIDYLLGRTELRQSSITPYIDAKLFDRLQTLNKQEIQELSNFIDYLLSKRLKTP